MSSTVLHIVYLGPFQALSFHRIESMSCSGKQNSVIDIQASMRVTVVMLQALAP